MNIYLNNKLIGNSILSTINTSIYFDYNLKVHDECRGYLINNKGSWCFIGLDQYNLYTNKKIVKNIALILESPHKSEYDNQYNPLRPANGRTGTNINNKICKRNKLIKVLCPKYDYKIYLINSIQYQCSCYNEFHGLVLKPNNVLISNINNCNKSLKNKIFRLLFNKNKGNLCADFLNRLNNCRPFIIYNCVTSVLKNVVKTSINNSTIYKSVQYVDDIHPSSWK